MFCWVTWIQPAKCISSCPLVNQSFFRGFTIFPMKRTVRVYLSRITRRKGLLNLTRGGWGTSPDLQVSSFTVAPAASVPFSWTFSTALWITCKDTKQNDLQVTTQQAKSSLPPSQLLQKRALPGAGLGSTSLWEGHHQPLPFPPSAIRTLLVASFTVCAECNTRTADSQRALKMTDGKKFRRQRNLVI